ELGLELGHREYSLESDWTPVQDAVWKRQARALILSHPILFLRLQLPGAIRLLLAPGDGDLMRMLGMQVPDPSVARKYLECEAGARSKVTPREVALTPSRAGSLALRPS
ncbi:MAG TPA: hypothetical protein VLF66_08430, partial [Thermoanaerobaculia bacterium]|nr:hypothetical protein [Thermoanaerobaculia bacterium]